MSFNFETASAFSLMTGNENGTSANCHVQAFLILPGGVEKPISSGFAVEEVSARIRTLQNPTLTNAHRTKSAAIAGEWKRISAMVQDDAVIKIVASKKGRASSEEWNRQRAMLTGYAFLGVHRQAPHHTLTMTLTGDQGMVHSSLSVEGRYDILTYAEVQQRVPGYRLAPAFVAFTTRERLERLFTIRQLDQGSRPVAQYQIEEIQTAEGEVIAAPVRKFSRTLKRL